MRILFGSLVVAVAASAWVTAQPAPSEPVTKNEAPPPEAAPIEVLAAGTPEQTLTGNTFIAPAGWTVRTKSYGVVLEPPERGSTLASILDGTVSFVTSTPGAAGDEFVAGEKDGKRTRTTRDNQHEYVFIEN